MSVSYDQEAGRPIWRLRTSNKTMTFSLRELIMLNRLPPRLHMFVRFLLYSDLGYLAAVGAHTLLKGGESAPLLWIVAVLLLGGVLGSLVRKLPLDVDPARRQRA